ncbi:MAG TPA: response regulator [Chitinophagaceae bacterium]|jgi:CheY-like chemotaxis protein|nr:response regulator [Chitinophagaceae bacterium]
MNTHGPVIVIEDDIDDQELLVEVFQKLGYPNKIEFFQNGQDALDYLNRTDVIPFIILSDINMPKLDGFALRSKVKMDAKLQVKCIPYLFFTTASSQRAIIDAYSLSVQGFFIKQNSMKELEKTIRVIMEYWSLCASPNNF